MHNFFKKTPSIKIKDNDLKNLQKILANALPPKLNKLLSLIIKRQLFSVIEIGDNKGIQYTFNLSKKSFSNFITKVIKKFYSGFSYTGDLSTTKVSDPVAIKLQFYRSQDRNNQIGTMCKIIYEEKCGSTMHKFTSNIFGLRHLREINFLFVTKKVFSIFEGTGTVYNRTPIAMFNLLQVPANGREGGSTYRLCGSNGSSNTDDQPIDYLLSCIEKICKMKLDADAPGIKENSKPNERYHDLIIKFT